MGTESTFGGNGVPPTDLAGTFDLSHSRPPRGLVCLGRTPPWMITDVGEKIIVVNTKGSTTSLKVTTHGAASVFKETTGSSSVPSKIDLFDFQRRKQTQKHGRPVF